MAFLTGTVISGSLNVFGPTTCENINADNITASLYGSASYALTSSCAVTASFAISASRAVTTDYELLRKEPTGFPNRTDSSLSYTASTGQFALSGSNFDVFVAGRKFTKNSEGLVISTPTSGSVYYIYYDSAGVMQQMTTEWEITGDVAPISSVYFGEFGNAFISEERHGLIMDSATHNWIHDTQGPQYSNGLAWSTITASLGSFNISAGEWHDDDIEYKTSILSTARLAWYTGSGMGLTTYLTSSIWGGGAEKYNNITTGQLVDLTGAQHGAMYVYVTNGTVTPLMSVYGQRTDSTLANARANNTPETLVFGNFPYREAKLLYRVIINTGGIVDITDYRTTTGAAGNYNATDHGTLSGLLDDDHPQYLLLAGRTGGQNVSGGITASLQGTASMATTASYALNAVPTISASWASASISSSNSITASHAISASWAPSEAIDSISSSWASSSISASYADVANSVNPLYQDVFAGQISDPKTLYVNADPNDLTGTGSSETTPYLYVRGGISAGGAIALSNTGENQSGWIEFKGTTQYPESNYFYILDGAFVFDDKTGTIARIASGSGEFLGTSSFARNSDSSSYALSASYAPIGAVESSSYALSSSYAPIGAVDSASYAASSSTTQNALDLVPRAPKNLTGSVNAQSVVLTWTNPVSPTREGTIVQRSSDSGSNWTTITTASATAVTLTDSTPVTNSLNWYRAAGVSFTMTGSWSATSSHYVAGAAAWAPSDITNLSIWLRADSITGSVNDPVYAWVDKKNSFVFNSAGSNAPQIKGDIGNTASYVSLDGTDDHLGFTPDGGSQQYLPQTWVIVMRDRSAGSEAAAYLAGDANTYLKKYPPAPGYEFATSDTDGGTYFAITASVINYFVGYMTSRNVDGCPPAYTALMNSSSMIGQVSNYETGYGITPIVIGDRSEALPSSNVWPAIADYFEIMIITGSLSQTDLAQLDTYLRGRYTIG